MYAILGSQNDHVVCLSVFDDEDNLIQHWSKDEEPHTDCELTELTHTDENKFKQMISYLARKAGLFEIDPSTVELIGFSRLAD